MNRKKIIAATAILIFTTAMSLPKKQTSKSAKTSTAINTNNNNTKKRTVQITNGITPPMLEYRYCGKHSPESFSVSINNKKIEAGKTIAAELTNDTVEIEYNYSFAKGLYKGKKIVTMNVKPQAEKVNLAFSWKDPLHMQADNAQALSIRAAKKP